MMDGGDFRVELDNLDFPMNISGDLDFDMDSNGVPVPISYKELLDKPKLNGETIEGNMNEIDPTVPDWAKSPTKPEYSAEDVGAIPEGSIRILGDGDFWEMLENM